MKNTLFFSLMLFFSFGLLAPVYGDKVPETQEELIAATREYGLPFLQFPKDKVPYAWNLIKTIRAETQGHDGVYSFGAQLLTTSLIPNYHYSAFQIDGLINDVKLDADGKVPDDVIENLVVVLSHFTSPDDQMRIADIFKRWNEKNIEKNFSWWALRERFKSTLIVALNVVTGPTYALPELMAIPLAWGIMFTQHPYAIGIPSGLWWALMRASRAIDKGTRGDPRSLSSIWSLEPLRETNASIERKKHNALVFKDITARLNIKVCGERLGATQR